MLDKIFDAIRSNDAAELTRLLESDPSLAGQRSAEGMSPLSLAAYMGRTDLVEVVRTHRGTPDFFEACIIGDEAVVRAALAEGQNIDAHAPDGFTPLGLAVFFGQPGVARILIDAGADLDRRSTNTQQVGPVHAAVARGDLETLESLLMRGANPNAPQEQGFRPVHSAAASGRATALGLLCLFGADLSARTDAGQSPAELARAAGHTALADRIEALLTPD